MDSALRQANRDALGFTARWSPLIIAVGVVCLYFLVLRPSNTLADWGTDYPSALSRAAVDQRRVLLAFHTDGCAPCLAMERMVLSSQAVRERLDRFIPVHIDPATQPDLANQFRVLGTPTYAIVDARGHVISWCEGYQPVGSFLDFLERAGPPATPESERHPQAGS